MDENPTDGSFLYTPPMPPTHQTILAVLCSIAGLAVNMLVRKGYGEVVYKTEPIEVIPVHRPSN
jgi:hypothetical protein